MQKWWAIFCCKLWKAFCIECYEMPFKKYWIDYITFSSSLTVFCESIIIKQIASKWTLFLGSQTK